MNLEIRVPQSILDLPGTRYFKIGEVSSLCDLNASILRYWESEFPCLKPITRKGNRRYYKKADILLILKIKTLLYTQGFTIDGARNVINQSKLVANQPVKHSEIKHIINELIELEDILSN